MERLRASFSAADPDLPGAERLEEAIRNLIASGGLRDGEAPPQRTIAEELGISLALANRVFNKLKKDGLLYGERGRGSFVAFRTHFAHDYGDRFSLDEDWLDEPPPASAGPILCNLVERLNFMDSPLPETVAFMPQAGGLKEYGAEYLAQYGLRLKPCDVTISHNAYLAFSTAFQICCEQGAAIAAPELSFLPIFSKKLAAANARLVPLECDSFGIIPEALENACRVFGAKLATCSPGCELPTATIMHLRRRERIAEIARRHDLAIIENCWLMPGFEASPPPLAALAPERTIFLEHGTKMLSHGNFCSFSYIPPRLREKFIYQRNIAAGPLALLARRICAHWLKSGLAQADFSRKNAEVNVRNDLAREIFAGMPLKSHKFARYCWLELEKGQSSQALCERLRQKGVLISPAPNYLIGSICRADGILVGLCHEPERERLAFALRAIRAEALGQ